MDKEKLKEFAKEVKVDLIGIASIDRFKKIDPQNHPKSIFPEVKSVIVVGKRITRGALRGIEEGTQFSLYSIYGYHWLNNRILALTTFKICEFLEDNGYEAVPLPDIPIEVPPMGIPVKKGKPAPNVLIDIEDAAIRAGIEEISYCGIFLTEEFGPRQRFQIILTDAEIEPDPLVKPGSICKRCMECVKGCPSYAIPHIKENKKIRIKIEDYEYEWADIHLGKCTLSYHGGDSRVSPFIHKDFPGWNIDARKQDFDEETAYKFCWTLSTGKWRKTKEFPSGYIIEGHAMIQKWGEGGSYGICGSRGCMRSCFNYLEKKDIIEQKFEGGDFIKRKRWILPYKVKKIKN